MAAILGTKDRIKKVSNIKTSTLIIHGDIDPLVKPKNAFHANKLIANSELLMIENMGHLIEDLFSISLKKNSFNIWIKIVNK